MKKILMLSLVALGLSSCVAVPGLTVYQPTIVSEYSADLTPSDGVKNEVPVVCDDRETILNYQFDYDGDLYRWSSELVGRQGTVKAKFSFDKDRFPQSTPGRISVDYIIPSGQVPLSSGGGMSAQAIVVTPVVNPVVIGYARVRIRAENSFGDRTGSISSDEIPVVDNCPAN